MAIIDWLYPKHCPVCLTALPPGNTLICEPCRKKIRYVREPVCFRCGTPLKDPAREYCRRCEKRMPPFEQNISWAEYASKYIRRMLTQVKYHGNCQLLDFPCADFAEREKERMLSWGAEALIPVPVHKSRYRMRGYNQAEEIADRMAEVLKLPVDASYLLRVKKTEAQKKLSDAEREMNLMHVFGVSDLHKKYETVILVDDIYTTGSTLSACTRVLKASGIRKVYCAVLAIGRDR